MAIFKPYWRWWPSTQNVIKIQEWFQDTGKHDSVFMMHSCHTNRHAYAKKKIKNSGTWSIIHCRSYKILNTSCKNWTFLISLWHLPWLVHSCWVINFWLTRYLKMILSNTTVLKIISKHMRMEWNEKYVNPESFLCSSSHSELSQSYLMWGTEVLTTMRIQVVVFCVVTPCTDVIGY